jgi:hypothetical protein
MKWNKETYCNCFKCGGEEVEGKRRGDDVTDVPYKPSWNCHYEFPPYNKYILIKNFIKK